ncbi:preQ(1) synthase [Acidiferrimicrobium sp. IK]|uniref:preQ(1) synthase n=1 Tax=Acidiferrimicrobium sp. IK TaxID=2871700 RepID=UPI0021CB1937|nr:preQ(1) synthase [Acidiferrimicrobium sp. IK]MCU4185998.1 preQ(1) synthase [Acidiferrimicrobium sp. IK]
MSDTSKLTSLGSGATVYRYDQPDAAMLELFDNQHPATPWVVELECTEFTSLCPMTRQPDFGRILIHYAPSELCVESKSLKLYLGAYRNHGAFHEDCVNRIADDLVERIAPRYLRVFGDFNVRGGIAIKPLALRVSPALTGPERAEILEMLSHHDALRRG